MKIPRNYREILVQSMYWDDMIKKFPGYPFREEDVEYEKSAENVDSIYIVITSTTPTGNMIYWRWGLEAKFYHHLQALYQVIEGKEMVQPYINQLGNLWRKCQNPLIQFQGMSKKKRFPNNEEEDKGYLRDRYEKAKIVIIATQGNDALKRLIRNRDFEGIIQDRDNIIQQIMPLLQNKIPQIQGIITNSKKRYLMIVRQNPQDAETIALIDLYFVMTDIYKFLTLKLFPIDYIVAFILKSYEKRDIQTNHMNSFRIFGLKSNETIWLNAQTNTYFILNQWFIDFIRDNINYLTGRSNIMTRNDLFIVLTSNEANQETLTRNYFERNFNQQIVQLNQIIGQMPEGDPVRTYLQNHHLVDLIVKLPKRERKLIASILQKKKDQPYAGIVHYQKYYQGEKLHISFDSLPIYLYLFHHTENKSLNTVLQTVEHKNLLEGRYQPPGAGAGAGGP